MYITSIFFVKLSFNRGISISLWSILLKYPLVPWDLICSCGQLLSISLLLYPCHISFHNSPHLYVRLSDIKASHFRVSLLSLCQYTLVPILPFSQWESYLPSWVPNIRESKNTLKGVSTFPWSRLPITGDRIINKCLIAWCLRHDLLCHSMAQTGHCFGCTHISPPLALAFSTLILLKRWK